MTLAADDAASRRSGERFGGGAEGAWHRCRCSQLQQPCGDNFDCCGHQEGVAETPTCSDLFAVCCMNPGQPSSDSGDCCGIAFICSDTNICEPV